MFHAKDEMIIHVREDQKILLEFKEEGTVRTKTLSVDSLTKCISDSIKGIEVFTGLLPVKTLSYRMNADNKKEYVVLEFPEERATVNYEGTEYENFPIPRLIFGFGIYENGGIAEKMLGVPALGRLTPDTPMYYYPFSNVSGFSLCTGGNSLPRITSLHQLSGLIYHIISMPDNDDYYDTHHNRLELGHRDLLEHLKDKDRQYYYDNILVPMEKKTLKDFL